MSEQDKDKIIIREKMKSLYHSVMEENMLKALREGKTIHMTLTLDGPFEIWFDEKKEMDGMSPLES